MNTLPSNNSLRSRLRPESSCLSLHRHPTRSPSSKRSKLRGSSRFPFQPRSFLLYEQQLLTPTRFPQRCPLFQRLTHRNRGFSQKAVKNIRTSYRSQPGPVPPNCPPVPQRERGEYRGRGSLPIQSFKSMNFIRTSTWLMFMPL